MHTFRDLKNLVSLVDLHFRCASVAQGIERGSTEAGDTGSSPVGGTSPVGLHSNFGWSLTFTLDLDAFLLRIRRPILWSAKFNQLNNLLASNHDHQHVPRSRHPDIQEVFDVFFVMKSVYR